MGHFIFLSVFLVSQFGHSKNFATNELDIKNAPDWVKQSKVEKVTDRIQSKLEWTTKKTPVFWYANKEEFMKAHSLGATPDAVTIKAKSGGTIHMGPTVTVEDYQTILGHELVHLIFFQKYHGSIPRWLEEGFANHLSNQGKVDYKWLSRQQLPLDVTKMDHPYAGRPEQIMVHYKTSQALVEMLAKKCNLQNLLQLSVEKKMADYIKSFCEIPDINVALKKWIQDKAKTP